MKITTYRQVDAFLAKMHTALERDEALNSLMYGIALRVKRFPDWLKTPPYLATVDNDQGLVLAGTMTPPHRLILFANRDDYQDALEPLAHNLIADHWNVPGATGPNRIAQDFAAIWSKLTGASYKPGIQMGVYELRKVISPVPVSGKMRLATKAEIGLIAQWMQRFQTEALGGEMPPETAHEMAAAQIDEGNIYIWQDGQPVSMAAKARPTVNGITVNYVYTPPELRGKGYASACVATLSQSLLDAGYTFCTLFTDLANPTSNSIYQKIGYHRIGEFNEYIFASKD